MAYLDWTEKLDEEFKDSRELKHLTRDRYFGYVMVNFQAGRIISANPYQTILSKSELLRRHGLRRTSGDGFELRSEDDVNNNTTHTEDV